MTASRQFKHTGREEEERELSTEPSQKEDGEEQETQEYEEEEEGQRHEEELHGESDDCKRWRTQATISSHLLKA